MSKNVLKSETASDIKASRRHATSGGSQFADCAAVILLQALLIFTQSNKMN